jgi:hypothetical protein
MMCSCKVCIPSCRETAFIQGPLIIYTWERISHGVFGTGILSPLAEPNPLSWSLLPPFCRLTPKLFLSAFLAFESVCSSVQTLDNWAHFQASKDVCESCLLQPSKLLELGWSTLLRSKQANSQDHHNHLLPIRDIISFRKPSKLTFQVEFLQPKFLPQPTFCLLNSSHKDATLAFVPIDPG